MKFDRYAISPEIKQNLIALGFRRPTDIQFKAIPSIMDGEDVLAIAQTGTGKTAAFAIPLIDRIHREKSSKRCEGIQCMVMVPTRELALQIGQVFIDLSRHTRVKTFALHGGVEQDAQINKLQVGIDILIATPGRMFDLINQKILSLSSVRILVLDEADHMLDQGFIEDIKYVKKMIPFIHQTLFFSATINHEIKKLAYSQVKSTAIRIQISPDDPVAKNVTHFVMYVEMDDKRHFLERFILDHPDSKIIVFVRTRVRAERVVLALARVNISALALHGEKEQTERIEVLKLFKLGDSKLLVATDVSARGIDIPDVNYVINYDLPEKAENYVHRVGRTGRGIKKGVAISFCSETEKEVLAAIEKFLNKKIDVITIGKKDYALTINKPKDQTDLKAMLDEIDFIEMKRRKQAKRRK